MSGAALCTGHAVIKKAFPFPAVHVRDRVTRTAATAEASLRGRFDAAFPAEAFTTAFRGATLLPAFLSSSSAEPSSIAYSPSYPI